MAESLSNNDRRVAALLIEGAPTQRDKLAAKRLVESADEIERLRALLARWVRDADRGQLDGVDLQLMVESEQEAAEAAGGET